MDELQERLFAALNTDDIVEQYGGMYGLVGEDPGKAFGIVAEATGGELEHREVGQILSRVLQANAKIMQKAVQVSPASEAS